ncbi:hypothetical protein [Rhabdochlamydiaceae symbiont of Dictyostelium giganteum]|uniref:hypothetical protein n=1 Tax=Rhabdochlamydiaceae symbiont of Dictyostelium giganteum TaxID=3342349 RepID=UPI00384A99CD
MLSMPIVDYVTSLYPSLSLNNTLVIGCQHILSTTHSMLRSLYPLGLSPQNVFLLGKCYSSNQSVWQEMLSEGINVSPLSFFFKQDLSFDTQFSKITLQFLEDALNSLNLSVFDKIIIIDDGGQLIEISTTLMLDHRKIVGIEQTSSGYEKIKNKHLQFPVINVARSEAKLLYESPFISEIVIEKALKRIARLNMDLRQVLIIGNGVIGSSIYTRIKHD